MVKITISASPSTQYSTPLVCMHSENQWILDFVANTTLVMNKTIINVSF